jgi:predicted transcriptional regulator
MATPKLDIEVRKKIHELKARGMSNEAVGSQLGICASTVSTYFRKPLLEDFKADSESSEITGDTWRIALPKTRIKTLEELVAHCEIDLSIWEVERFICNKWEIGANLDDGKITVEPLFQIKAFLKKKKEIVSARKEIEALKVLAKKSARFPIAVKANKSASGNMLEVNIPDAHFGKLSWGLETGGPNYDVRIAEEVVTRAFEALLGKVGHYEFEEVILIVGNDILNSDDVEGRTTAGTSVSTDGRYQKTFGVVRTLMTRFVERLRTRFKCPVIVIMVPGNHDKLSVWHLGDSLECYFHNYKDVTIENTPRYRKYHSFGKVMLMFTHGDKGKRNDYPLLMATEQPEMFGRSKFWEAHTGHNHMTKVDEQHGVRVRVLSALCPADDWHAENGFVGNKRSAEAYVWNKDEGLIGIAIHSEL